MDGCYLISLPGSFLVICAIFACGRSLSVSFTLLASIYLIWPFRFLLSYWWCHTLRHSVIIALFPCRRSISPSRCKQITLRCARNCKNKQLNLFSPRLLSIYLGIDVIHWLCTLNILRNCCTGYVAHTYSHSLAGYLLFSSIVPKFISVMKQTGSII